MHSIPNQPALPGNPILKYFKSVCDDLELNGQQLKDQAHMVILYSNGSHQPKSGMFVLDNDGSWHERLSMFKRQTPKTPDSHQQMAEQLACRLTF
eukprot:6006069-Amphidinium_carterae.1